MTEPIVYARKPGLWEEAAAPLGEPQVALEDAIDTRIAFLTAWLEENTPRSHESLAGLDRAAREQIFWHHGYLVALRSVRRFIRSRRHVLN